MSNQKCAWLWVFLMILLLYVPLSAQRRDMENREKKEKSQIQKQPIPTEEQVLRRIDRIISHGDNIIAAEELGFFMAHFPTYVDSVKSQKIAQKIMDIPELPAFNNEYPEYAYEVTCS